MLRDPAMLQPGITQPIPQPGDVVRVGWGGRPRDDLALLRLRLLLLLEPGGVRVGRAAHSHANPVGANL